MGQHKYRGATNPPADYDGVWFRPQRAVLAMPPGLQ